MASKKKVAKKLDMGKPQVDLVPKELIYGAAYGYMYGLVKYERFNWLDGGISRGRRIASVMRHIIEYSNGADIDPESGVSHLYLAASSLGMLITDHEANEGEDNRRKK